MFILKFISVVVIALAGIVLIEYGYQRYRMRRLLRETIKRLDFLEFLTHKAQSLSKRMSTRDSSNLMNSELSEDISLIEQTERAKERLREVSISVISQVQDRILELERMANMSSSFFC